MNRLLLPFCLMFYLLTGFSWTGTTATAAPVLQTQPPQSIQLLPKKTVEKEKIRTIRRKSERGAASKAQPEPQPEPQPIKTQSEQTASAERPDFGQNEKELKTSAIQALISATENESSQEEAFDALQSVSYTHLTLPTICSV